MGFYCDPLVRRGESEASGDAVFEQFHVRILKLDDFFAVHTDQMIVGRVLEEIGIVNLGVATKIEFAKESAFDQDREGAVDSGA